MRRSLFISKIREIEQRSTCYAYGFTGQLITSDLIKAKAKQYPGWYSKERIDNLNKKVGAYGYDCSGLIKGAIRECGESFPDINADMIFKLYCKSKTDPPVAGDLIHKDGHIGLCIDSEYVIEASSAAGRVIISKRSEKAWKEYGTFVFLDQESVNESLLNNLLSDLQVLIKKYGG